MAGAVAGSVSALVEEEDMVWKGWALGLTEDNKSSPGWAIWRTRRPNLVIKGMGKAKSTL